MKKRNIKKAAKAAARKQEQVVVMAKETKTVEEVVQKTIDEEPVKETEPEAEEFEEEATEDLQEVYFNLSDKERFEQRMDQHKAELKELYMGFYHQETMYEELCQELQNYFEKRKKQLRDLDVKRERHPNWYKKSDHIGMMMDAKQFAGSVKEAEEKLSYIEKCGVKQIQLCSVAKEEMEDLAHLSEACHEKEISVGMDFVMNHTSEDHEWAVKAKNGEEEYRSRYFFFNNYSIPAMYERSLPQVFPMAAPGNFTYLEESNQFVMTRFHSNEWDLNYQNPVVFNEMIKRFLDLANQGVDVICLDEVPYLWKQIGTDGKNLPQVHTILRMMRIISDIVCPGTLLLGKGESDPQKAAPYFGTFEKPECHLFYDVTTMETIWNTVATRDVRLLKKQMDILNALPEMDTFQNFLRSKDEVKWELDYQTLREWGMEEKSHKQYLNSFFQGAYFDSFSRGGLYNDTPVAEDAGICGTTASLCGIEKAGFAQDEEAMQKAIDLDLMLHAFLMMQSGTPMIYSGDELGQVNDYSYKEDDTKAEDARYLQKGNFQWNLVENIEDSKSVQGRLFNGIKQLEEIRTSSSVFDSTAVTWTLDSWDDSVICLVRADKAEKVIGIFNFSEHDRMAWINEQDGIYEDMLTGEERQASGISVPGYGFYWLRRKPNTGR